jgi:hypothetical protein
MLRRAHHAPDAQPQIQLLPIFAQTARHPRRDRKAKWNDQPGANKPAWVRSIDPRGAVAPSIRAIAVVSLHCDPETGMLLAIGRTIRKCCCCMTAHSLTA